ncbi:MAG: tRNA pseudouridine(13) synthase TruD [Planctomycetaceae bacterium]
MPVPQDTISRITQPPRRKAPVLDTVHIRTTVQDFQVEEIPAYELTGSGDHAWLWIEKSGLSSPQMISLLCDTLRFRPSDVGLAGQKDRWALTRQFVSVPGRLAAAAGGMELNGLKVLSVTMHKNKLKTGHLKGNRFILTLRSASPFTEDQCSKVSERLQELSIQGFPNYYGPQRFGHDGNTLQDGLRLLHNKLPKNHWPENQTRTLKRLALSAVQSAVFNLVVADRVEQGTVGNAQPGEVVIRKGGIKPFVLPEGTDPTDYVPAGPMYGPEMVAASGAAAESEQQCLTTLGLKPSDFLKFAKLTSGARRRMLEFPEETTAALTADGGLQVSFNLPSGTYATTLLQEVAAEILDMGNDDAGNRDDSDSPGA